MQCKSYSILQLSVLAIALKEAIHQRISGLPFSRKTGWTGTHDSSFVVCFHYLILFLRSMKNKHIQGIVGISQSSRLLHLLVSLKKPGKNYKQSLIKGPLRKKQKPEVLKPKQRNLQATSYYAAYSIRYEKAEKSLFADFSLSEGFQLRIQPEHLPELCLLRFSREEEFWRN